MIKENARGLDMEKVYIELLCYDKYKSFIKVFGKKEDKTIYSGNAYETISEFELKIFEKVLKECQKKDLEYKRKVYFTSENSKDKTKTDMNQKYKRTDFSKLETTLLKSRMAQLTGNEPDLIKISAGGIFESPRVCLKLAQKRLLKTGKPYKNEKMIEILHKAVEANKNKCNLVLTSKEKKKCCKMFFPEFPISMDESHKKINDRYIDLDLLNQYIAGKKSLSVPAVRVNEICCSDASDRKELYIKEYLMDLIAFLHVENKYNMIMPTNHLDLTANLSVAEEAELQNDEFLWPEDKKVMRVCENLLKYQKNIQREQNVEHRKLAENYVTFVMDYMKFCCDNPTAKFSLLNLHLFEDIFGFAYISHIASYLQSKEQKVEKVFSAVEKIQLLNLLAKIFEKLDTETRIEFSKYVIDYVYGAEKTRKAIRTMNALYNKYFEYRKRTEKKELRIDKFKKRFQEKDVCLLNCKTLGDVHKTIEQEAMFMMPYYKLLCLAGNATSVIGNAGLNISKCLVGDIDSENSLRMGPKVKRILKDMCTSAEDEDRFVTILSELVMAINYKCWEQCGVEIYE